MLMEKKFLEESFQTFANQVDRDGYVVVCEKVADKINHPHKLVYGFEKSSDFYEECRLVRFYIIIKVLLRLHLS